MPKKSLERTKKEEPLVKFDKRFILGIAGIAAIALALIILTQPSSRDLDSRKYTILESENVQDSDFEKLGIYPDRYGRNPIEAYTVLVHAVYTTDLKTAKELTIEESWEAISQVVANVASMGTDNIEDLEVDIYFDGVVEDIVALRAYITTTFKDISKAPSGEKVTPYGNRVYMVLEDNIWKFAYVEEVDI